MECTITRMVKCPIRIFMDLHTKANFYTAFKCTVVKTNTKGGQEILNKKTIHETEAHTVFLVIQSLKQGLVEGISNVLF